MPNLSRLIEYQDIFDDNPEEYTTYLKNISKKQILLFSSAFISVSILGKESATLRYQLYHWFSKPNEELYSKIIQKLSQLPNKNLTLIHVHNVLKIFEHVIKDGPDTSSLSDAESEIQMFKSVLALNQEFNSRDSKIIKSTKDLEGVHKERCRLLTLCLCYYDLMYFNPVEKIVSQFIKAYFLFQFFESYNNVTKAILKIFCENRGVDNWIDYLAKYFPLFISIIQSDWERPLDIHIRHDEKFDNICRFLDSLIINDEASFDDFDFITSRSKPFFKRNPGEYRMIHPLFVIEKIFNGLYFSLSEVNISLPYKIPNFRSFFTTHYSEHYLAVNILDRCFPKKSVKLSGKEIKRSIPDILAEPDYYSRKKKTVYLFECKDVLIDKKTKQSNDFKKIESALKTKFYKYLEGGKPKEAGIMQLLNNIKRILNNDCPWDNSLPDDVYIYPILLVHYNIYNTPYINYLLNKWFREELSGLKIQGFNTDKVKELVIIEIDTFLYYHERFQNKSILLCKLINDYLDAYPDFSKSFSVFLSDHIIKKQFNQPPRLFRKFAENLINSHSNDDNK